MIKIGIIKEYKIPNDFRTPFTPSQADEINKLKEYLIVCQSSEIRCFDDKEYNDRSAYIGILEVASPAAHDFLLPVLGACLEMY